MSDPTASTPTSGGPSPAPVAPDPVEVVARLRVFQDALARGERQLALEAASDACRMAPEMAEAQDAEQLSLSLADRSAFPERQDHPLPA